MHGIGFAVYLSEGPHMVETAIHSPNPVTSAIKPTVSSQPVSQREMLNPDGSAVPDIIAYHHRPEDLGDHTNQDVPEEGGHGGEMFGADGLTFGDFLDVINPLQHIPVVSSIYRAMTGDEISPGARIAGGALFGGPIGLAVAAVNAVVESSTGDDIGETIIATLTGESGDKPTETAVETATEKKAVSVAEAGPMVVGAGTVPVSLIPAQPSPALQPTIQPFAAAAPLKQAAKLPFGGLGTMTPGLGVLGNESNKDPATALLQARAAVPFAGPIQGLGNSVRPRAIEQPVLPSISTKLSDRLSALAAQTGPAKTDKQDNSKQDPQNPAPLPAALVPQRMFDTLDRYQQMKSSKTPAG